MNEPKTFDELADGWLNEAVMSIREEYTYRSILIAIAFSLQAISEKMDKIEQRLK